MTVTANKGTATPDQYKVIGTRAPRLDGLDKVPALLGSEPIST